MKKPSILRALRQPLGIPAAEFGKGARIQRLPDARGELIVKIQVVHDRQTHGEHLLGLEQVAQIRPRIAPANPYFKTVYSLFLLCNLLVAR